MTPHPPAAKPRSWPPAALALTLSACLGGGGGPLDRAPPDATVTVRCDPCPDDPFCGPSSPCGALLEHFVPLRGVPFTMGSPPPDTPDRPADETQRRITLAHTFALQTTEVTRAQWEHLMGTRPWRADCEGPTCPATRVTWYSAAAYANARSALEGLPECYQLEVCTPQRPGDGYECGRVEATGIRCAGYRLPTEAEWEFAARGGGLDQRYPWGDAPATCDLAIIHDGRYIGCSTGGPHPTCARPAGNTPQGICDLAGNVWEWVDDAHGPSDDAPTDGSARQDPTTAVRVVRGGGYGDRALTVSPPPIAPHRATHRSARLTTARHNDLGFRLARTIP